MMDRTYYGLLPVVLSWSLECSEFRSGLLEGLHDDLLQATRIRCGRCKKKGAGRINARPGCMKISDKNLKDWALSRHL
jgi:hypothetical protein